MKFTVQTNQEFQNWLAEVRDALQSIGMGLEDWQQRWRFDFEREHKAGVVPAKAAEKANRFWWREQNKVLNQDCCLAPNCWLPRGHSGDLRASLTPASTSKA
jgi:hypothetical protein